MNKNTFSEKINSIFKKNPSPLQENCHFYESLPFEEPKLLSIYEKLPFKIKINQEGYPILFDLEQNILPLKEANKKKKEYALEISRFLKDSCYEINGKSSSIEKFYLLSPSPVPFKKYRVKVFQREKPEFPNLHNPFFLIRIFFKKRVEELNKLNEEKLEKYEQEMKEWQEEKEAFLLRESKEELKWNYLLWNDPITMKEIFYKNLLKNRFPLSLAFEMGIEEEGEKILFNLILLEKDEIIKREASFDKVANKIKFKKDSLNSESTNKNLASVLFFFISHIFFSLPKCQTIEVEASENKNILSQIKINRKEWEDLYSYERANDLILEILTHQFKRKPIIDSSRNS